MPRVLHVGGNGHSAARLSPAWAALAQQGQPIELVDLALPGFEGRPPPGDLDGLLTALEDEARAAGGDLLYASGIGALLALALRARGRLLEVPLLLQGPVLAGLKRRRFPRLMRWAPVRALVVALFRVPLFQAFFARRYFLTDLAPATRAAFFEGYARCAVFGRLFAWIGPAWIDELLADLRAEPSHLDGVGVWWGDLDQVVGVDELRATEAELGRTLPLRRFPTWGHYPALDAPDAWVQALAEAASTPPLGVTAS